ncbi:MAG: 2-hydroxychromene-2-carboxylate isomerase [Pseudomonadota bacterium]
MIQFWYDFGSPAAYLAWTQLDRIREKTGREIEMKPMLLGGVFKATGNATPVAIAAKGAWMMKDLGRHAARYGVPLTLPPGFPINTLHLMRGVFALDGDARQAAYVKAVFEAIFARGDAMGEVEVIGKVLTEAGFDAKAIMAATQDDAVKEKLKASTEEAVSKGIFGAPTFFVDGEMHFGQDRIDWVIDAANAA